MTTNHATEVPPPCPTCRGTRSWDIDMSDDDAEWCMWCEQCAIGEFPFEGPQS